MAHSSRIPADYVEGSSSESGSESDGSDGSEQGGGAGRVDGWTTSHQVHAPAPLVVRYPTATTEDAQTPPPNNQEGPDDGPTDLPADNDWMDLSWARRRSSTLSDFFDPKNIALFKIRRDQKVFDQQCDAARRHTHTVVLNTCAAS